MTFEFQEGQDFSGRYSLLHEIANRSIARIWLALDSVSNERVILTIFDGRDDLLDSCRKSIDRTRGLIHENILQIHDCGTSNGHLFLSTRYTRGVQPLTADLSFAESWPILEQMFAAIQYAHGLNVVHGNLSPESMLTDPSGHLYLTGFSLPPGLYQDSLPEREKDRSDDVYSLGCIIFQLLVRREWQPGAAFEVDSPVPVIVQQTVAAMLSSSSYERPTDLGECARTLGQYATGESDSAPIQITSTSFTRATQNSQVQGSDTPYRLPRDRQQVSAGAVLIGMAILAILGAGVFFLLPEFKPDVLDKTPATITDKPDMPATSLPATQPEPATLAPLEIAQLEYLKEEAKLSATELVRQQVYLEDAGVLMWAGGTYREISDQADQGDAFYREEDFQSAIDAYNRAMSKLEELAEGMSDILAQSKASGTAAILNADVTAAITSWTIAQALAPNDPEIETQLRRAENLGEVLDLVRAARENEQRDELDAALATFRQAAILDADWQPASEGVARVRAQITAAKFGDAMSRGFTLLARKQYAEAKTAFDSAQKIFPASTEPADGLLQIELAERMDLIEAHKSKTLSLVRQEHWGEAITEYATVLGLDPTLTFAVEGQAYAEKRLALDETINRFLAQPTLMREEDELKSAKEALVGASRVKEPGPVLSAQLTTLSRLISVARIPIQVALTSDNKTDVTIYRVGNLGTMAHKTIELVPGDYTIVGKRRGYRDVRQQLTLLAGEPTGNIHISCTDKI